MKFENPIMNISMFEVENIVTISGEPEPAGKTAEQKATEALAGASAQQVLTVTF